MGVHSGMTNLDYPSIEMEVSALNSSRNAQYQPSVYPGLTLLKREVIVVHIDPMSTLSEQIEVCHDKPFF